MDKIDKILKIKLASYLLISALSFSYLILPERAGISVPLFVIIQFICLYFITPAKKPLLIFIPIFILGLNAFISGSVVWRNANLLVSVFFYSLMILMRDEDYDLGASSVKFLLDITRNIYMPFAFFNVPVKWAMESKHDHGQLLKRILAGVIFSIPCLVVIIVLLSSADEIFAQYLKNFKSDSISFLSPAFLLQWGGGLLAGFYLFGLVYLFFQPQDDIAIDYNLKFNDLVIINTVLFSVLFIYSLFTVIQFKYLFAGGGELPYGLSYTYYARRGFFELLFLTGINILAILFVVECTREETGFWANLTKVFCCCLCFITFILLISSYYRMWLYNDDSGLTRLRFLVFGFLIFEGLGLICTFIYILKPYFNIFTTYLLIGLTYYLLLNLVPMDSIVAKSQIDRYLVNGKGDIEYVLSLSSDAAGQISRLLTHKNRDVVNKAKDYFAKQKESYDRFDGWQKFNLSEAKCKRIADQEGL